MLDLTSPPRGRRMACLGRIYFTSPRLTACFWMNLSHSESWNSCARWDFAVFLPLFFSQFPRFSGKWRPFDKLWDECFLYLFYVELLQGPTIQQWFIIPLWLGLGHDIGSKKFKQLQEKLLTLFLQPQKSLLIEMVTDGVVGKGHQSHQNRNPKDLGIQQWCNQADRQSNCGFCAKRHRCLEVEIRRRRHQTWKCHASNDLQSKLLPPSIQTTMPSTRSILSKCFHIRGKRCWLGGFLHSNSTPLPLSTTYTSPPLFFNLVLSSLNQADRAATTEIFQ